MHVFRIFVFASEGSRPLLTQYLVEPLLGWLRLYCLLCQECGDHSGYCHSVIVDSPFRSVSVGTAAEVLFDLFPVLAPP